MTKKHYEAIASICKAWHDFANVPDGLALSLADYFATDNKNFNREMFLQACGIKTRSCTRHTVPQGNCIACRHDEDKTNKS